MFGENNEQDKSLPSKHNIRGINNVQANEYNDMQ